MNKIDWKRLRVRKRGWALLLAGLCTLVTPGQALAQAQPSRQERLPEPADQMRWSVPEMIVGHRNMHRLFPVTMIEAGTRPSALPQGRQIAPTYRFDGATRSVADYIRRTNTTGILVIKDGKIVLERYAAGNTPATMWASRSVAKSVTSTLMGMAIKDGYVKSVDDPVSRYVPELANTAYGPVRIRNLLQMGSGIYYTEGASGDAADLQRCTVDRHAGCFLALLQKYGTRDPARDRPQGSVFNYSSADALLNGIIITRATGMSLPKYLEEKLWRPFGMEHDAYWITESEGGLAMGPSGFGGTLRDWGRFGLFLLNGGKLPSGRSLLPDGWMIAATTPSTASLASQRRAYGYHWWLKPTIDPAIGAPEPAIVPDANVMYMARGSAGQIIAIDPVEHVVFVKWATWATPPAEPSPPKVANEDTVFMASVLEELAKR